MDAALLVMSPIEKQTSLILTYCRFIKMKETGTLIDGISCNKTLKIPPPLTHLC